MHMCCSPCIHSESNDNMHHCHAQLSDVLIIVLIVGNLLSVCTVRQYLDFAAATVAEQTVVMLTNKTKQMIGTLLETVRIQI